MPLAFQRASVSLVQLATPKLQFRFWPISVGVGRACEGPLWGDGEAPPGDRTPTAWPWAAPRRTHTFGIPRSLALPYECALRTASARRSRWSLATGQIWRNPMSKAERQFINPKDDGLMEHLLRGLGAVDQLKAERAQRVRIQASAVRRLLAEKFGNSLARLARDSGISASTISNLLRGENAILGNSSPPAILRFASSPRPVCTRPISICRRRSAGSTRCTCGPRSGRLSRSA